MNEYYFTTEQLKEMQDKPFEEKVLISQSRILKIIQLSKGNLYIGFSGGKDSSVVVDMTAKLWAVSRYKEQPLNVALANTNCEYKGMLEHARKFVKLIEDRYSIKINYIVTSPDKKIKDIFLEEGYPIASKGIARKIKEIRKSMEDLNISYEMIEGHLEQTIENAEYLRNLGFSHTCVADLCGILSDNRKACSQTYLSKRWIPLLCAPFKVSPKCCDYLKKKPSKKIADMFDASVILGEMAIESKMRTTAYKKTGCVFATSPNRYKGKPIGFWNEQDVLRYLKEENLPLFSYYKEIIETENGLETSGCKRTGCKVCLFGCQFKDNGIHQLKELEPNVCKVLLKPIEEGGFGYEEVINFLNDKCGCNIDLGQKRSGF